MAAPLRLCRALVATHPEDAARLLENLSADDAAAALEQFRPEESARVLERIEVSHAAACLERLADANLPHIVTLLPVETLAAMLGRTESGTGQRLLAVAPPDIAEAARRLALHPVGSAGALMDPGVFALPDDINAGEARLRLRRLAHRISYYIYVVDREKRLVGVVNLRQLMQAKAGQPLSSLMRHRPESLSVHAGPKAILNHQGWRTLHTMPVVDGKDVLRGVLRYETLRRLEEQGSATRGPGPLTLGLAIMEFYWTTATDMVQGIAGMAEIVAAGASKEVSNGS